MRSLRSVSVVVGKLTALCCLCSLVCMSVASPVFSSLECTLIGGSTTLRALRFRFAWFSSVVPASASVGTRGLVRVPRLTAVRPRSTACFFFRALTGRRTGCPVPNVPSCRCATGSFILWCVASVRASRRCFVVCTFFFFFCTGGAAAGPVVFATRVSPFRSAAACFAVPCFCAGFVPACATNDGPVCLCNVGGFALGGFVVCCAVGTGCACDGPVCLCNFGGTFGPPARCSFLCASILIWA